MGFDVIGRVDGEHHPPINAKKFIPWALQAYTPYKPEYLLAVWEPDSVNHETFYRGIREQGRTPMEAIEATWTHQQFQNTLYTKVLAVDTRLVRNDKISPHGYPSTYVNVLYGKA